MRRRLHRGSEIFELDSPHEGFKRSYGSTMIRREPAPEDEGGSAPVVDPEKQWIKIQVIDDDTGKPVPGVPLELRLPGKPVKEYKTHAETGRVSESDLSPGVCDILKINDEEAWEVISVS